ncbi:MAG TPA: site-specific integrase [Puia sp.]|nr:site-specific integrase [Puia sp.]
MAFVNFYIDKPFLPSLSKDEVKAIVADCKAQKKHYPKSILNPRPTALYLFFTFERGRRMKMRTLIKVLPEQWDFYKGKYKSIIKGSLELNNELDTLANSLLKQYSKFKDEKETFDEAEIQQLLQAVIAVKTTAKRNALDRARAEFETVKQQVLTAGTLKEYKTVFKSLDDFQKKEGKPLAFGSFNQAFFDRYEKFLVTKEHPFLKEDEAKRGLFNDTIFKYCATLRSFLQWSYENGYHQNAGAFSKIKTQIKRKAKNEIVALTEDEVFKLLEKDFSATPRLEKVRDLFCFGCFTGQRFSDIMRFSRDDFDGKKWDFMSIKVKKRVIVPFTGFIQNALPILKKYKFTLPVISNQKFNEYLKEIGEIAGLDHPVRIIRFSGVKEVQIRQPKYEFMSSHMARRTFVTIMLEKGVPITIVQKITQHADIRMLMKYESHSENALFESLKKT